MADYRGNRAARRTPRRAGITLATLAIVGALIGTTATSTPAAASDRMAETIIGAALFYGLTQAQAPHFYDRGHYFNPRYYYFDDQRGHWRAHNRQQRRYYGHNSGHNRGYDRGHDRGHSRHYAQNRHRDDGYGQRSHDRRGRNRDHGGRSGRRH